LICLVPSFAFAAGELSNTTIHQVENIGDDFQAYISFFDDQGLSFNEITADNLKSDINEMPLNITNLTSFEDSEKGIAFLFMVDVSGSVSGKMFEDIKNSMNDWIENMDFNDYGAIISFGQDIDEVAEFTDDTYFLSDKVGDLKANQKYTRLNEGMSFAIGFVDNGPQYLPKRKVIVVLSDGENTSRSKKDKKDNEIIDLLAKSNIPVYSIGSNYSTNKDKDKYLSHLQNMSDVSNGLYFD